MNKKILKTNQSQRIVDNVLKNMESITKNNIPVDSKKLRALSDTPSVSEKPEFLQMPDNFKEDHKDLSKEELTDRLFQMIMHSNILAFENEQLRTKLKEATKTLENKFDTDG
jgi:hypothetical protein